MVMNQTIKFSVLTELLFHMRQGGERRTFMRNEKKTDIEII